MNVRWLIRRDLPEVLEIENRSFNEPWTEEEFLIALRQRNTIGCVAESTYMGQIYGFMVYELHKGKLVLLNFAVAPEVRRTGVGSAMVERLTCKLSQQRRRQITTSISEGNLPAQLFFANAGFKATAVKNGEIKFRYVLTSGFPDWQGVNNRLTEYDAP